MDEQDKVFDDLVETFIRKENRVHGSCDPLQGFDMTIRGLGFECSSCHIDLEKKIVLIEAGLTPDMVMHKLFDKCAKTLMVGYKENSFSDKDIEWHPFLLLELSDDGLKLDTISFTGGRHITAIRLTGSIKFHKIV